VIALTYHETPEEWRDLAVVEPEQWTPEQIASRVLMHHTSAKPTKNTIERFVRHAMKDFDPADGWSITSDELAAYVDQWG